jgi:hypothetical protein
VPRRFEDLWRVAAVLTSPVASAWLARRRLGSGMSPKTLRITASDLTQIPLPVNEGEWEAAAALLRRGETLECGRVMLTAHDIAEQDHLREWWAGPARSRT